MTVDSLAEALALEFGEEYTDADIAAQFQAWVIEVIEEITTTGRWFWSNDSQTISLVASTRTYSLDTDVSEVRQVYDDTNDERVDYAPVERLVAHSKGLTDTGDQPLYWYYEKIGTSQEVVIGLYPVPNATAVSTIGTLTVHTLLRPATLGASTTIPLPPEYIRVAKDGVRAKVKLSDGDTQGFQLLDQRYVQGVQLLNARFHGKPAQKSPSRLHRFNEVSQSPATPEGK